MKKYLALLVCLLTVSLANYAHAQALVLQPLNTFGTNGDGSIWPGQVTGTNNTVTFTGGGAERAIAYNPVTGHILVVQRTNSFSLTDYHIYVLDGATGTNILDINGNALQLDITSYVISGGNLSFTYNMIGVADDGAIYVGNLSSSANPPQFNLYRWASETAPQIGVYHGNPGDPNQSALNERWGDTFAVRGSGASTQVLLTSRGTTAAILTPPISGDADAASNPFISTLLQTDVPVSVGLGFGLCFGPGNTFYAKSASSAGTPLVRLSYNLGANTATTQQTYALTNFPGRTGVINVLAASNLMVGIEVVAGNDYVRLYDVSNPVIPPVELDRQQFTTNAANALFAGYVAFGSNGVVYAMNTENGMRAFTITSVASNSYSPAFTLQPTNTTIFPSNTGNLPSNAVFTVATDGTAPITYQWLQGTNTATTITNIAGATNSTYVFANPQTTDNGRTFAVIASNAFGSVTSSVATMGVTTNIPVTLPYYEPFNYAVGAIGTNGGWYVQSGASGNSAAGNLTVPWLPSPNGNMFSWLNGTMSYRLPFGIYSSGTVYYSIALQVPSYTGFTAPPGTLCGFANGTGTTFMKLNMNTNGLGQYFLGCSIGSSPITYATNLHNPGDTVFVVESYTFTGGASDLASLWINPDPSTFGAATPPAITVSQAGTLPALDRFFFRHSGGNQPAACFADEIRIGLTWADVTPQARPPLSVNFDGTNAVVSWPTLTSGYTLQATTNFAPTAWNTVTNAVNVVGTNNVVTVKATTNFSRYFELVK